MLPIGGRKIRTQEGVSKVRKQIATRKSRKSNILRGLQARYVYKRQKAGSIMTLRVAHRRASSL